MFSISRKEIIWGGKPLILETGKLARQADGSVLVTYGETTVLCVVVADKKVKPGIDFFPLTVHYQEKTYAANKIPGGYFKREARPSEKETLTSRLIDRPIRPLFPETFFNEVQIICTTLAFDGENDSDIVAMVGASAALAISGVPFEGPIGGARVGYHDGQYLLNPTLAEMQESQLDMVVAGTDTSVMMVESEAKELSEAIMLGAVEFAHQSMQPVIQLIKSFKDEAGKSNWSPVVLDEQNAVAMDLYKRIRQSQEAALRHAYTLQGKQDRYEAITSAKDTIKKELAAENPELDEVLFARLFKKLEKDIVRNDILKLSKRIDGRDSVTVRPIVCEVDILPRAHGSALFTRGETQALVVTTLGTNEDAQTLDLLSGNIKESFMLHYNFPSYSVGEVAPLRAPGRREIGHGKLAWRGINPLLPTKDKFPYTIRVVSEITESNGSSSMASVCGASLSLMAAGVPMLRPIAGIAMGLIKEQADYVVLSDIMGDEDHLGDMDFKVAGTDQGVTALQMDIKINGITTEIMKKALDQAHTGRIHILGKMAEAITASRSEVHRYAPTITTIVVPKEKIREIIGSGGKVIREICETSGAKVDISDDGTVNVAAVSAESKDKALGMIRAIVQDPEIGTIYDAKVVRIVEFGAFVSILSGKSEGLLHISEIVDRRLENVTEILSEGQAIKVKLLDIDPKTKKLRFSMKVVDQETGLERPRQNQGEEGSEGSFDGSGNARSDRRDRSGDRGDRGGRDRDRGGRDRDRDRGDRDRGGDRDRRSGSGDRGDREKANIANGAGGGGSQPAKRKKRFF